MKRKIDPFDYANTITKAVQSCALVTTKFGDKVNAMTIGWGMLGIEWNTPVFILFVRDHRFTKELVDASNEFTINIPLGVTSKKIFGVCGSESGRNIDKISKLGLTLETPDVISTPGIKELPLTLECKVIYKQKQDKNAITPENLAKFHPQNVDSYYHLANKDFHTAYYGEIVSAYIIE